MEIDWQNVRKILVVRLRSIGDTVLTTPSLITLRRLLPDAQIDILLEDWVAPVLREFESVDNVLTVSKKQIERIRMARRIRSEKYGVVFNLHGGTTATFFVWSSGAKHRVGYEGYQYSFLYNHLLSSASDFWQQEKTHSAEQQLALLGFVGVPVEDRPKSALNISDDTKLFITNHFLGSEDFDFALIHPVAAFESKQWSSEKFASVIDHLADRGLESIVIATPKEKHLLEKIKGHCKGKKARFLDDVDLDKIAGLAVRAKIFVGNDSGIAHIAAAVKTPSVVIFGSSNRDHWRPWTDSPNEIVYNELSCQPCAGSVCKEFDEPKCIKDLPVEKVVEKIELVLNSNKKP